MKKIIAATTLVASLYTATSCAGNNITVSPGNEPSSIVSNLLQGLRFSLASGVNSLNVEYDQTGQYKSISVILRNPIKPKDWQNAFKSYADKIESRGGWQQCMTADVQNFSATMFCIHSNSDDIVSYAVSSTKVKAKYRIEPLRASDQIAQQLLKNKQRS